MLRKIVLPVFDGNSAKVQGWLSEVWRAINEFQASHAMPFAFVLTAIRAHLVDEAARWWDHCPSFPGNLQQLLDTFEERFAVPPEELRQSMRNVMFSTRSDSVCAVMSEMEQMMTGAAALQRTNRDYRYIVLAIQRMDCPVLEHRLAGLPIEHPQYDWQAFATDVRQQYLLEAAQQKHLCDPYWDKKRIRFGQKTEYLRRYHKLNYHRSFCVICMSTKHYTHRCQMMYDIEQMR